MVAKLSITGELQPLGGGRGGICESKEADAPNYAPPEASACPLRNFKYRHKERAALSLSWWLWAPTGAYGPSAVFQLGQ